MLPTALRTCFLATLLLMDGIFTEMYSNCTTKHDLKGRIYKNKKKKKKKKILHALMKELQLAPFELQSATDVLLSGCSAGGQSIVVNADLLASLLPSSVKNVKALADAGWLMPVPPLAQQVTSIEQQLQAGIVYWNGTVNSGCSQTHSKSPWLCYLSTIGAYYVSTSILIQTSQQDQFQLGYNCQCAPPFNAQQTNFAQRLRQSFVSTLTLFSEWNHMKNSVFSPACWSHCITENDQMYRFVVQGTTFAQGVSAWFTYGASFSSIDNCQSWNCTQNC